MHGQCVMELLDPLPHNALNCIGFHRGVFIESYLTYNFSLILLGSTCASLLGSKVTQVWYAKAGRDVAASSFVNT